MSTPRHHHPIDNNDEARPLLSEDTRGPTLSSELRRTVSRGHLRSRFRYPSNESLFKGTVMAILGTVVIILSWFSWGIFSHPTWPHGPLSTSGRWIKDSRGQTVNIAGTNWPGHMEVMIPEGLQYNSAEFIAKQIKSLGMNAVRLTYAIEMVDDILAKGHDTSLHDSAIIGLGQQDGEALLANILKHNPSLTADSTRLDAFDLVAKALEKEQIYLHLDNHVSKAQWCCGEDDGNAWFGDKYFDTDKWKRGLAYMANYGKKWPNFVSVGMRNELRKSSLNPDLPYDFANWYQNMVPAAQAIHAANPDVLIYFSGLNFSEALNPIALGSPLTSSLPNSHESFIFNPAHFPFSNKIVLELHIYTMSDRVSTSDCTLMSQALYDNGFNAMSDPKEDKNVKYRFPVVMSEWGIAQDTESLGLVYTQCLMTFLSKWKAGWMNWSIAGSQIIRSGTHDSDDTWGMLNHDWTDWRSYEFINQVIKPLAKQTTGQ